MFERQHQYSSLFGRLEDDPTQSWWVTMIGHCSVCLPTLVYLMSLHTTEYPRPSLPHVSAYCKWSKTGAGGGLGMRLGGTWKQVLVANAIRRITELFAIAQLFLIFREKLYNCLTDKSFVLHRFGYLFRITWSQSHSQTLPCAQKCLEMRLISYMY